MIRRLPQEYRDWDIQEMIDKRRKQLTQYQKQITNNLKIQKIIISYSLREVIETQDTNIDNFKKTANEKQKFQAIDNPNPTRVAPLAIVTFQMECSKDYFVAEPTTWQKILIFFWSIYLPYSKYQVKGKRVSIQKAPEPDDIYWENCGISYCGNVCRRLVGKFFILMLLLLGLVVQMILKYYQLKFQKTPYAQIINISFSLAVTLFNALLGELLQFVTKKQRLQTVTEQSISLTATLSVLQFINSGIIVMFSSLVINFNTYSMDNLAENVVTIMLINMVLPHFIILIWDGFNPVKRIQKWRIKNTNSVFIQKQLNQAYEGADVKIAIRCAYLIKTIWLSMFYGLYFPIVIPIGIMSILGFYHVQKYMYLKHYKVPNMISSALTKQVLDLLDYSPFFLSVSTFFLYLYLNYFNISSVSQKSGIGLIGVYIGLGLSIIYILIPTDKINQKIFKFKLHQCKDYKLSYRQVQNNFNTDYDIANPVYHQINKKKKNHKYFKAIGHLGGLFNFLTVKKQTSSKGGESRLIFNAGAGQLQDAQSIKQKSSKKGKNKNNDIIFDLMEMPEIRKPLSQNHGNIFQSYMSCKQKQRQPDHSPQKCKQKKIRREYMQPCKINQLKQPAQFIVNISSIIANQTMCMDDQLNPAQLTPPSIKLCVSPKSILKNKNKNKIKQQNLLHPNFVSKINISDIVPIFMGQQQEFNRCESVRSQNDIVQRQFKKSNDDTF